MLRPDVPVALDRIVQRCLRKDPEERWQSLRDVVFELSAVSEDRARPPLPSGGVSSNTWSKRQWGVLSATMLVVCASVVSTVVLPAVADHGTNADHAIRFVASVPTPLANSSGGGNGMAFVSPDGRSLVWVSANDSNGRTVLAVQRFDSSEATVLRGTDDARWPFWSPDSRAIAFFAGGELRKVQASGGLVETIAKAPSGAGGAWSTRGTILFAPDRAGALYEVSDRGGEPRQTTIVDTANHERGHQWPAFLPDGRHFLYFASSGRPEQKGLYLAAIGSPDRQWLGASDGGATWAPPRYMLFTRAGMLLAQPFDTMHMRIAGEPREIQPRVCGTVGTNVPPCFSASTTGVLVYHVARLFRHRLAWFSRTGRQFDVPIEAGSYFSPVLSPDGVKVALERHDPETWQLGIWQFDLGRRVFSRVLDAPQPSMSALWAPDGRTLAFATNTEARHEISTADAQGGPPVLLFTASTHLTLTDWSRDRRRMLFQARGDGTGTDVWVLPIEGGEPAAPYLHSRFDERQARFSPDGRWVAYCSDESGRPEIYVQPFPSTGAKWQISNNGGSEPTWRRDGRELFYLSADRRLMAVPIALTTGVTVRPAAELFRVPADAPRESRISYAPAPDGERFLFNVAAPDRVRLPWFETEVILNWPALLGR